RSDAEAVVAAIGWCNRYPDAARETAGEVAHEGKHLLGRAGEVRQDGERKVLPPVKQVAAPQVGLALLAAQIGLGEHAAEMPPAPAVLRVGEHVRRAVGEGQPRARMVGEPRLLRLLP